MKTETKQLGNLDIDSGQFCLGDAIPGEGGPDIQFQGIAGYGDGSYPVEVELLPSGRIVSLKVTFITEDELYDEPDGYITLRGKE